MGHPTAIFLNPPDPNYICGICLDVFDDPVSLLQCGHTFCRSCLQSSLDHCPLGRKCPECRTEIDVDDDGYEDEETENNGNVIHSVRVIQSAIGNSIVRCRNGCFDENGGELLAANDNTASSGDDAAHPSSPTTSQSCGCNWTGPLSQWYIHASHHCPITPTTCPIPGCTHTCPRSLMKNHTGSPSCVKAAVASQVTTQMNDMLCQLKKQMKKEVECKVAELKREKIDLEGMVQREMDGRLELQEVNHVLRREVRGLKKTVKRMQECEERSSSDIFVAALDEAEQGGEQSKKKKREAIRRPPLPRRRDRRQVLPELDPNVGGENREENKKRKKSKKRRRRQQQQHQHGDEDDNERGRSRAVSRDYTTAT